MSIKLLPLDNMLQKVLTEKNLEEKLSTIIGDMEQEFIFSTMGIFLKVPNMEIYRFKIGRNLSHTFSKNTIFTQADPLITELMSLEMIDMKYPGQYMFEKDYSHLLIAPIFFQKELLGFVFTDKEENYFDQAEITKFHFYASIMSLSVTISKQQDVLDQHRDLFEYYRVYNHKAFMQQASVVFSMMDRYKRYLSLVIFEVGNMKKLLRTHSEMKVEKMMEAICNSFQNNLRESDLVGKMSKSRIAILLPETTEKDSIITIKRINQKIQEIDLVSSSKIGWGIKSRDDKTENVEMMLKEAEAAAQESHHKKKSEIMTA